MATPFLTTTHFRSTMQVFLNNFIFKPTYPTDSGCCLNRFLEIFAWFVGSFIVWLAGCQFKFIMEMAFHNHDACFLRVAIALALFYASVLAIRSYCFSPKERKYTPANYRKSHNMDDFQIILCTLCRIFVCLDNILEYKSLDLVHCVADRLCGGCLYNEHDIVCTTNLGFVVMSLRCIVSPQCLSADPSFAEDPYWESSYIGGSSGSDPVMPLQTQPQPRDTGVSCIHVLKCCLL